MSYDYHDYRYNECDKYYLQNTESLTVECEASVRGQVVANINKTIQRTGGQVRPPLVQPDRLQDLSRPRRLLGYGASRHILVETKHSSGSFVIGEVPQDVMENITPVRTYSRTKLEISEEPVKVLDFLGAGGYKVVAMANTPDNRIVWTLAKSYNIEL